MLFLNRMANVTDVRKWTDADESEDVDTEEDNIELVRLPKKTVVYEISGPLFFGATNKLLGIVAEAKRDNNVMILRMRSVPALDSTAFKTLEDIYNQCEKSGIKLILSHVNLQPLSVIKKQGLYDKIGKDNFKPHIKEAIERAEEIVSNIR